MRISPRVAMLAVAAPWIVTTMPLVVPAYNGPVWRFLGIYSGRISTESDLGYVWKAPAIAEIIDGQRRGS